MSARLSELKSKAVTLRKRGKSYKDIRDALFIPQSTLQGWIHGIALTENQKKALDRRWRQGLVKAREKAVVWHRAQKIKRHEQAKQQANEVFCKFNKNDRTYLEIALAFLYLGEGFKRDKGLGLGNSDPEILRFYVRALRKLYGIQPKSFRAELHLRADQDGEVLKIFWSRKLGIPISCFKYVIKDKRTIGRPTHEGYNGVCALTGGGVEIQRRLMYLANVFCSST